MVTSGLLQRTNLQPSPDLKVLYTSGQGLTDGMTALFVQKSAYLPKPYTIDQLAATLVAKFNIGGHSKL